MRRTKPFLGLFVLVVFVVSTACMPDPSERPVVEASNEDVAPSPSSAYHLVPPAAGSYDEMWRELRELESLSQPMGSGSAEQLLSALDENGGSVPAADVNPAPMIINLGTPDDVSLWVVAYSDSDLLIPETKILVRPTRTVLQDALDNEHVRGLSFNPFTKVSREEVFNFNVDKLYIAGLIGYLTAKDAEPGQRCDAANGAYRENKPYEALHHALRALDEREDWSRCEHAKLWATWEIDFPGARKMAHEELVWFIEQGNDKAETRALLEQFTNTMP